LVELRDVCLECELGIEFEFSKPKLDRGDGMGAKVFWNASNRASLDRSLLERCVSLDELAML
jgi:hypothetical protein